VLHEALETASGGRGRFVTILGDPGMGKTRLLAEFSHIAEQHGSRVLRSQSIEDPGVPPNFPWMLALRSYLKQVDDESLLGDLGDGVADVAMVVPELRERFSLGPIRPAPEAATARYQLYDSVTRMLLHGAERHPIVLLFDNLHAIDTSSLAMLEYFAHQIAGSSILVVGAYRESEVDRRHPLRPVLDRLGRNTGFRRIELPGLTRGEVAELLGRKLRDTASPGLVRSVLEQSGGNPLFVSEVGAMLLRQDPGARTSGAGVRFRVPRSLRDVIDARLASLPEDCCELLRTAAILGRDFELAALADLASVSRAKTTRLLQAGISEGIIEMPAKGRFRFCHVLYREVLYAEHNMIARITLHKRAGMQIERRFADDPGPHLSKLAYHFFEAVQAGGEEKAIFYCRQAADMAVLQRAYDEAVGLLECALQTSELSKEQDLARRLELLLAMGRAEYQAGELNASTQTLMKAAVLAYRHAWWDRLAEVLCLFQLICQQSGYHHVASIPLHAAVLENLAGDDIETRARVLASLAKAYRTAAQPELAASSFRQAVDLARQCGNRDVLLDCLRKGNWTIGRGPQHIPEGLEVSREALTLAIEQDNAAARLDSIVDVIFQLCDMGNIDEVEQQLAILDRLARSERQPHFRSLLTGFETALAILRGDWGQALQKAHEGVRRLPRQGVRGLRGRFAFQVFAIMKAQGSLGQLGTIAERIISDSDESSLWLPGQILLYCELGEHGRARDALARLGDLDALPDDDLLEIALVYLSESCLMLGARARARDLFDRLQNYRGLNVTLPGTFMLGAVSGYLAELAAELGRPKRARELFEEAIAMNAGMHAAPALARTRVAFARWLLANGKRNERKQAHQLIAQGSSAAKSMKLAPVLRTIDGIELVAGTTHLTEREIDILRVIAKGASNKVIAKALNISHSTVTTHIRNIFRKIDVGNRTEAADFARRSGLLEHE
jgi:DNA-binding CsgD family transcriptional regulator/tetratricopeptide (TPR) repeat protein